MSYLTNLEKDYQQAQYMVVALPRRLITDTWQVYSGDIYYIDFDYGYVSQVFQPVSANPNSGILVESTSGAASLTSGQFYYDYDAGRLYVRLFLDLDPNDYDMVVGYELYFATVDVNWHRVPTDTTTTQVHFHGLITKPPTIRQASSDVIFGIIPTNSTSIDLIAVDGYLNPHLYDSSWNAVDIRVYHWVGKLASGNISRVISGVSQEPVYTDRSISIRILDRTNVLNRQYDYPNVFGNSFFQIGTIVDTELEVITKDLGKPIRKIYGRVDGFIPLNKYPVEDNAGSLGSPYNKQWVITSDSSELAPLITRTITASTLLFGSTTELTFSSVDGLNVDDWVYFTNSAETVVTNDIGIIVKIDDANNKIWVESGTQPSVGEKLKRSAVGYVWVISDGVIYPFNSANPSNGYTLSGGNLVLNRSLVDFGSPRNINHTDQVFIRAYGRDTIFFTLGGSAFGTKDARIGAITNPVVIIYDLLRGCGIQESDIDTASFTALEPLMDDTLGFSVPQQEGQEFDTYKDIIQKICQTSLLRLYINENDKWEINQVGPIGTVDFEIDDTDIIDGSFQYTLDHSDIVSDVKVEYSFSEFIYGVFSPANRYLNYEKSRSDVRNLHRIRKYKTIQSLHVSNILDAEEWSTDTVYFSDEADRLADRLSYIYGERRSFVRILLRPKFFGINVGDVVRINRTRMPGYELTDTVQSRDFVVIEVTKDLRGVEVVLDDQKGIEDNAGSW